MSSTRQDPFVRLAQLVGDFGNPFYAEERQRDIWNEASAFGLQLALWSGLLAATITVWTVGAPSVPYAVGALTVLGAVSGVTVAYAARLGVQLTAWREVLRWRMLPLAVLLVALGTGVVRAGDSDFSTSFVVGLATGALLAVAATAVSVHRARRDPGGEAT